MTAEEFILRCSSLIPECAVPIQYWPTAIYVRETSIGTMTLSISSSDHDIVFIQGSLNSETERAAAIMTYLRPTSRVLHQWRIKIPETDACLFAVHTTYKSLENY